MFKPNVCVCVRASVYGPTILWYTYKFTIFTWISDTVRTIQLKYEDVVSFKFLNEANERYGWV